MQVLSKAIRAFNSEKYDEALELFLEAEKLYGAKIVQFHIMKCQNMIKKLGPNSISIGKSYTSHDNLDYATRILLHNTDDNDYQLTNLEFHNLLNLWRDSTSKKSEDAEIKKVNPVPNDWPKDLVLNPLPDGPNDYVWYERYRKKKINLDVNSHEAMSIVIPTFNRSWILDITLACLVNQETCYDFEVIVADDGSKDQLVDIVRKYENLLDIKFVRQRDYGFQVSAVRNLGLRAAKYDYIGILDCDMAPCKDWVQLYMEELTRNDDIALIGPRKYIDTHGIDASDILKDKSLIASLPEIHSNNNVAALQTKKATLDWRLKHFRDSDNLRLCDSPFRYFSAGNIAFAKKWFLKVGGFDESFVHWGGEDNEFGYRMFRAGCFFKSISDAMAFHQEPPGKENETDREVGKSKTMKLLKDKVPYPYRKILPLEQSYLRNVPLVTIYIPAYNCESSIIKCVESALNQTVTDLEVCVCNDGSTDNTLDILQTKYGSHPRVRILDRENGGIAAASNTAVRAARGYYIGQLDSDDYLEPDAVELCLLEFFNNRKLACVYTTNRNVNPDGSLIANGYNWPVYSREKLTTAMIAHHFRMFTIRAWNLTEGFNESITNAVDYDIYLKLSEIGEFKHINKISYNRVLHGENTSIKKLGLQKKNHFKVVNNALKRQNVKGYVYESADIHNDSSRAYRFISVKDSGKFKVSHNNSLIIKINKTNENIIFHYTFKNKNFTHTMRFSKKVLILDDDIFRVAMLCIPFENFGEVLVENCTVSRELLSFFEKELNCTIYCTIAKNNEKNNKLIPSKVNEEDVVISFSGGFDSLAAYALMPNSKLVSIDFGGNFSREATFFKKFPVEIVEWDIRLPRQEEIKKFPESKKWRFMLAPATMLGNKPFSFIATGTILEASPFWLNPAKRKAFSSYSNFGFGPGISILNVVSGLSEFGTTAIVIHKYGDEIVQESLHSIAAPESFKIHRKKCLIAAVNNNTKKILIPKLKYRFGSSIADDLITCYLIWKFSRQWVEKFYAENIPQNLVIPDMSFFEKLNVNNLSLLDPNLQEKLIHRIKSFGIDIYTSNDMDNLKVAYDQLMKKYK